MSGKLVLMRHGESEWNLLGKWTGWTDVSLTSKGASDALKMGELVKDIKFDEIYTSKLKRSIETMQQVMKVQGQDNPAYTAVSELNERDYGDYTGLNKWDVKTKVGDEKFNAIRRNFDEPIPNGETLHDVYNRVVPWYREQIVSKLQQGENILFVAHGNSIRALVKYIDSISDADIAHFEMKFGTVLEYQVDAEGRAVSREEMHADIEQTHA